MGIWIVKTLAISLLLTLILELLFAVVTGIRDSKELTLVGLVNVLTNPFVVLVYFLTFYYTNWNRDLVTGVLEISAVVVEALYYKNYSRKIKHPWLFSIGANVFSYFTGEIISQFL